MYDVIVVGGRCAGSPLALLLAKRGRTVLVVDKDHFPSDQVNSTLVIHQSGCSFLKKWGLLDKVAASNCPPLKKWHIDFGPLQFNGVPPGQDGVVAAYAPRRIVLDKIVSDCAPKIANAIKKGKRESDILGGWTTDVFRKPYGPGWALVGDAGSCYEFTSAQGITNAFRQAEWTSEAIDAGLTGRKDMQAALAEFETSRNAFEQPYYDFTYQQTTLDPPPAEALPLFGAIAANEKATGQFIGLFAQTMKVQEFFSPEHIGRIMSGTV